MEYHDPLNASLVLPFQRPRDGRSTLPILPSLPQLGLLRCREPNPRRHHGTPPSPRKIRRCCADRLNPPPESHESNVPERHPYREKFTVEEAKGAHVLRWSWVDLPIIASCPL